MPHDYNREAFRDPALVNKLFAVIEATAKRIAQTRTVPITIMEVCGGHTHTIFRYGLETRLPDLIEFAHGPGCPVCVLPRGRIEEAIAIARYPEVIFTTFGDAMRVPGEKGSLMLARAQGADVRMVYSPLDALRLAQENPNKKVVFFAIGFETTIPSTALTLLRAKALGVQNFFLLCCHITIIPTLKALLEQPDFRVDGFIAPGHVSIVIGTQPYTFIAEKFFRPVVIAGFEPVDVLSSLLMILQQIEQGKALVQNQYTRVVTERGNAKALAAIEQVYEPKLECEWRGFGKIAYSGLQLREQWHHYDAERHFRVTPSKVSDSTILQCGAVLTGRIKPQQCVAFGASCTPNTPLGALMVSSEGACAAYYQYQGIQKWSQ